MSDWVSDLDFLHLCLQVCPNDPEGLLRFKIFLLCPAQRMCICGICTQTHLEQDPYLINTSIPASSIHFIQHLVHSEAGSVPSRGTERRKLPSAQLPC